MSFLEKLLPSLRRSEPIAQIKKDLAEEKEENLRARDRVLRSLEAVVDDFDYNRRRLLPAPAKTPKKH